MSIYKQYDQVALNYQFNTRAHVPEFAIYLDRHDVTSRQTEKLYFPKKDIPYGKGERERLDIYPSSTPDSKTLVFIHGGYWHKHDKSLFQFIAGGFQHYDINIVLINYPLAPTFSISQIVDSCRKAIRWIHQNISEEIYVMGHSAGGHLAVSTIIHDHLIKGVCSLSGLFNLLPVQLADINEFIRIDNEAVLNQSPVKLIPVGACPVLIAVGADESEEFREQSEELYKAWKEKNLPVELLMLSGVNHYSIVEEPIDKQSLIHNAIIKLMKL